MPPMGPRHRCGAMISGTGTSGTSSAGRSNPRRPGDPSSNTSDSLIWKWELTRGLLSVIRVLSQEHRFARVVSSRSHKSEESCPTPDKTFQCEDPARYGFAETDGRATHNRPSIA